MSRTPLYRRATTRPLGLCVLLCLSASASLLASPRRAQDAQQTPQQVSEAARRENARKAAQQKKDSHVYTNEDLKQSQILTQQDRSRIEARKNNPATTPENPAQPAVTAAKNSKILKPPKPRSISRPPASPWISRNLRSPLPCNLSHRASRQIPTRAKVRSRFPALAHPAATRFLAKYFCQHSPANARLSHQICLLPRNHPPRSPMSRLTLPDPAPRRQLLRRTCCSLPDQFLRLRRLCLAPRQSPLP